MHAYPLGSEVHRCQSDDLIILPLGFSQNV